jgi:Tfp pilus assembly protein PilF
MQPAMAIGFSWRAKTKANLDPDQTQGLAKPDFEKVVEIGSVNPEKNKNDLYDAYNYMASYFYNVKHDKATTITYYEKMLQLKPDDATVKENLTILKK